MEEKNNPTRGTGSTATSGGTYTAVGSDDAGYADTPGDRYGSSSYEGGSQVRDMVESVAGRLELRRRVREHPYAAVATAAAVGYLLGGGRMMVLFGFGLRAALMPFVREQVKKIAQTSFSGENAGRA